MTPPLPAPNGATPFDPEYGKLTMVLITSISSARRNTGRSGRTPPFQIRQHWAGGAAVEASQIGLSSQSRQVLGNTEHAQVLLNAP